MRILVCKQMMLSHDTPVNREKAGWLPAAAAALAINLVLLSILPVVNLGTTALPKRPPAFQPVRIVRPAATESIAPKFADQQSEVIPEPEIPAPQPPGSVDLSWEPPERSWRPDLPTGSVQAHLPRLPDIPLATIDFKAMGVDGVFEANELDQPLLAVSRLPPLYPLKARRASVEGWVEIEFLVNTDGRVDDIQIINARPAGVFEESVRQAVSAWRFQPGTIMGEPVKTRVATTIRFELEENP